MTGFSWFQMVSGSLCVVSGGFRWFEMVSGGLRWFQVVSSFSKYPILDVWMKLKGHTQKQTFGKRQQ